ncbi:hypothetical protein N8T08_001693 [Aspergillus melleus]|uniref:Uncharacterized protein n=1 Tax=Aspergillus melleus TaxID=138277 RepID=A0ACC3AMW9_9EURO|nr:hypothetical protein N8T08_001693 [Aspergillus melleus]
MSMRQSEQLMRQNSRYRTHIQPPLRPPNFKALVPARHVAYRLVDLYFSSFELKLRILHHVQFLAEYGRFWGPGDKGTWSDWAHETFSAKLLALMACASCFASNESGTDQGSIYVPDNTAKDWIQAVESWAKLLTNRARLSLDVLQVKCLLLLAQQAVGHDGDYSWLAGGSLMRDAIMIGLHRDPSSRSCRELLLQSGSGTAISAAEFVLVSSSLTSLLTLVDLSRVVFRRIGFNFGWALVYNYIAVPVAAGVFYPIQPQCYLQQPLDEDSAACDRNEKHREMKMSS